MASIQSQAPQDSSAFCCGGACISKKSNNLLTWKNPNETGVVFGSIVFTLISLKFFNIINLILRLSFYTLILAAVAEYSGKLILGTGFVTKFRPAYVDFFQKNAATIGGHITDYLKIAELQIQDLVYAKDIERTFKVAIVTYFLYKLTSWISIFTLLLTSTIATFSVPLIYETNKEQIDAAVRDSSKILKQKAYEFQEVASEKSAPYLKKAGPVGDFIKSKFPKNRTASSSVGATSTSAGKVKPEVEEPIKATTTGIELPNIPTNTFPTSTTSATDSTEVDINQLEQEIKKTKAEVQNAL